MIKHILTVLMLVLCMQLSACSSSKQKTAIKTFPPCSSSFITAQLDSIKYIRKADNTCVRAIRPFDTAVWREAPLNSHKVRNLLTVLLGCAPATIADDTCDNCGVPGYSNTLMLNFDMTRYDDSTIVRNAILAVYAPHNAQALTGVQIRAKLNVGDELQSVGQAPTIENLQKNGGGWVYFDISRFAARAIHERRNSVQFEISLPCQTPATNMLEVGVLKNEPRILVEYH